LNTRWKGGGHVIIYYRATKITSESFGSNTNNGRLKYLLITVITFTQWRLVGAEGGVATLNIITVITGITNCRIKYNKIKHNTHVFILNLNILLIN